MELHLDKLIQLHKTKMVKEKSEKKIEQKKPQKRTATVEELFQNCPKCGGDLLVRVQSEKGLDYKCEACGHEEFRKWK